MVWWEKGLQSTVLLSSQLMVQEDGFWGFFRGMSPRLARKVISAAIVWTGYEEILKAIARQKVESSQ
jgi:high-affinity Fe2+/Pb2+ permease